MRAGAGVMPALVVLAMVSTSPRGAQGELATSNTNSFHDVTTTLPLFLLLFLTLLYLLNI